MKNALMMALGLALVAGSAQAFNYNVGANPDGTYSHSLPKGSSTDTIKFSLTAPEDFDFKLFSTVASGGPVSGYFALFDSTTSSFVDSGTYSGTVPAFTSLDLAKGKYFFTIVDFATRPVKSPDINLTVSAVPEPQTYGLMLSGLALFAVTFARRRV